MDYIFPPAPQASAAIDGQAARLPVHRIYCVGRNYAAHAREMGNDDREPPFFFAKPADALVETGTTLPWPMATEELHHEAELVVALARGGANVSATEASGLIWGYAAGVDLTRRDLQAVAKKMARPWDMAKGFDRSAPCGAFRPIAATGELTSGPITLSVNGETRQKADLADMIWPVADIIAHLSRLVELAPGDLIYTGTPAGVGPLSRGDRVHVEIEGLPALDFAMGA